MRTGIVLVALGIALLAQWPHLPDAGYVGFLPIAALAAWLSARARPVALLACGFLWALLHAQHTVLSMLPASLEGRPLIIEGRVADLPVANAHRVRFDFQVSAARLEATPVRLKGRVRLSWYKGAPALLPGQQWRLVVRLKQPRGLVNPGGTDYERWLFVHGIRATGYVVSGAGNRMTGSAGAAGLNGMRYRLSAAIDARLRGDPSSAIITALAVGDRSRMSEAQWRTLRATGTSHLMAISGLHIGLVAGLIYLLVIKFWSGAGAAVLWLPAPVGAAGAAMLAGLVYAGLAGFALPTQRALVMLVVIMSAVIARRRVAPSTSFCLALAAVLLFDPFAVLSAGFWLSFGAVAAIVLGMSGRVRAPGVSRWQQLWWRWGRVQWLVAVGLLPVTIGWFFEYPLLSPLANVLAVPWAGCVLVPLVLAGSAALLPFPILGGVLLDGARWSVELLWQFLELVAGLELMLRPQGAPPMAAIGAAGVGALLLIAPRRFPARAVGMIWLLPLLLLPAPRPERGAYWLTLLDVGQGLAAVVRTRSHVLVYDTGPRYATGFDAGRDIVAPFLRSQGVERVNLLMISHEHNDHLGGARGLLAALPATQIMTNAGGGWRGKIPCRAGEHWRWDGVDFHVLHPGAEDPGRGNDGSCVLKVTGPGGRLLLPGDVERGAETALVARDSARLRAEVLVVPHHGGRSSSGAAFLRAVRPGLALIPLGYRNRYGFPHRDAVRRLSAMGVQLFDTARHGAITVKFDTTRGWQRPRLERLADNRIWRRRAGQ
jgi:competence protein ComEC